MNFSNNDTRKEGTGWDAIKKQIAKLEKRHAVHIAAYGEGNERRLTGEVIRLCSMGCQGHTCGLFGHRVPALRVRDSGIYVTAAQF